MKKIFGLCLAVALFTSPLEAQIQKGNMEVGISGSFKNGKNTFDDFGGKSQTIIQKEVTLVLSTGYFFTRSFQLGANLFMVRNSIRLEGSAADTADDPTSGFVNLSLTYHQVLANPKVAPYIGAEVGKSFHFNWDQIDQGGVAAPAVLGIGAFGGFKYFVSRKTSFGPQIRFRWDSIEQFYPAPVGVTKGKGLSSTLLINLSTLF